jgi:hypothetical protein
MIDYILLFLRLNNNQMINELNSDNGLEFVLHSRDNQLNVDSIYSTEKYKKKIFNVMKINGL